MSDNVKIKVGMDQSALKTGLAKLRNEFSSLRSSASGALAGQLGAVAVVGSITALGVQALEAAGNYQDLAERFDLSASALQRFSQAASMNGGSLEGTAGAMNKLAIAQDKVRQGDEELSKTINVLGISAEEFINLSTEEAMYKIADGIHASDDRTQAYAATLKILGKSSGELFTTLEGGSKSLREQMAAMGSMSDATIATLAANGDRIDAFKNQLVNYAGTAISWLDKLAEKAAVFTVGFGTGMASKDLDDRAQKLKAIADWEQRAADHRKAGKTEAADRAQAKAEGLKKGLENEDAEKAKKKKSLDLDDADSKTAKASKSRSIVADSLTRAGGGGIAYLAPEVQTAKDSQRALEQISRDTAANGQVLRNIEAKVGWAP